MYKVINGFTKKNILENIEKEFKGISVNKFGSCAYRGEGGTKCAIGLFIPDELYHKNMENKNILSIFKDHSNLVNHMPLDADALVCLQRIHDNYNFGGVFICITEKPESELTEKCKSELLQWVQDNVED